MQAVEIWVVWVLGHRQRNQSLKPYDFLFNLNRNYASILWHFRVIASYSSKVADFNLPTCVWRPHIGNRCHRLRWWLLTLAKRIGISQHNKRLYSADDPSTLCANLMNFGPVTTEIARWQICTFKTTRQKLKYFNKYLRNCHRVICFGRQMCADD